MGYYTTTGAIVPLMAAVILSTVATLPGLKRYGTMALPLKIHNLAWAVAFGLVGSRLISYGPIRPKAWLYLVMAVLIFNVGAFVCLAGRGASNLKPFTPPATEGRAIILEWVVPGLFFVGCGLYLLAIEQVFGIGTLLSDPASIRSNQGSETFKSAYGVPSRILFGLGPLCFVTYAVPSISRISTTPFRRSMVLLITTIALVASLGRTLLLVCFAWVALAWLLAHPTRVTMKKRSTARWSRRKVVTLLVLAGLVLFQGLAVLLGKTSEADPRIQPYVSSALQGSALTGIMIYLTGGVASFAVLVGSDVDHYPDDPDLIGPFYGLNIIAPAAKLTGETPPDVVRPFTYNPLPNNSYTYLDTFWLDFREFGIVVGPFLYGFGLTYIASRRSRSPEGELIRALLIALVLWVPFSYKYNETFAWVSLFILWMSAVSRRRQATHIPDRDPALVRRERFD